MQAAASGSGVIRWTVPIGTRSNRIRLSQGPKRCGAVAGSVWYSSMWKAVTRLQSMSGSATRASSISCWLGAEAKIIRS